MTPQHPKNKALPWILAGGGLVIVGVVVILLFVFGVFGGADQSNPTKVAQEYVSDRNSNNVSAAQKLQCSQPSAPSGSPNIPGAPTGIPQTSVHLQLMGDPQVSGNTATVQIQTIINSGSSINETYTMHNNGGSWCIDPIPQMGNATVSSGGDTGNPTDTEEDTSTETY